jgi:hypothetical protein
LTLLLLILGVLPVTAFAQEGRIVAYFDSRGTKRTTNSPGIGGFSLVFIYGEGFESEFVSGVQYVVDYGPQVRFVADLGLPPVTIGTSATGLSVGFGAPRPGIKFQIHAALVEWISDCSVLQNGDVWTGPHPDFPDPTPIVTRYPDFGVVSAEAVRSQTCQMVELDVSPLVCPNSLSAAAWQSSGAVASKDRWIAITVLGTSTVDLTQIDISTVRLEGVPPQGVTYRTLDLSYADGDNSCLCDFPLPGTGGDREYLELGGGEGPNQIGRFIGPGADGFDDLMLFFDKRDLAKAISPTPPAAGTEVPVVMTGTFGDGMPFEARDCIAVGGAASQADGGAVSLGGADASGPSMGFPNPNPFNPVTRVQYSVPAAQHVRVAIYDVAGRLVETLVNEVKAPGEYVAEWNAGTAPSGVYFYRFETAGQSMVRRATLLK